MIVTAVFTSLGAPAGGLSPTLTIRNAATGAVVANNQAMTEVGSGFYRYDFAAYDPTVDYVFVADGGSALLDEERYQFGTSDTLGEITDLHTRLTAARAGYLDNLAGGPVALEANVEQHVLDAWNSSVGVRTVTIQVADVSSQAPIVDVLVYVYTPAGSLITYGRTDDDGRFAVALDDGSYNIVLRKVPYSFNLPEAITVTQDATFTLYGSALVVTSPNPLQNCRLYEYCFKPDGVSPLTSVTGTAQIAVTPFNANSDRLISSASIAGTYDAATGMIYWDLVRGATLNVTISAVGLNGQVVVPNQESARITDLL